MRLLGLALCLTSLAAVEPAMARRDPAAVQVQASQERRPAPARAVRRGTAGRAVPVVVAPLDPGAQCRHAIQAAEELHRLPPGLLGAIARVESGRADPRTGALTPWPWTINAEGQGRYFDSKDEAVAAVQATQARGTQVIDVGCMQVNLHHHPKAFDTLEQALDPATNARYAGLFLKRLYAANGGDWEQAAAHYHSATPERGEAYRQKVLAAWHGGGTRLAGMREADPAILGTRSYRVNGVSVRALALNARPDLGNAGLSPLLDPVPPLRLTGQRINGRPVFMVELAQAAEPRRR
jgi:hypothetical protein